VIGESISFASHIEARAKGGGRARLDLRASAARSPGEEIPRLAAGLSLLLRRGAPVGGVVTLSATALLRDDALLLFPVPSLPGSSPVRWFGYGRGGGGVRFGWEGRIGGALGVALLAGPDSAAIEVGWDRR